MSNLAKRNEQMDLVFQEKESRGILLEKVTAVNFPKSSEDLAKLILLRIMSGELPDNDVVDAEMQEKAEKMSKEWEKSELERKAQVESAQRDYPEDLKKWEASVKSIREKNRLAQEEYEKAVKEREEYLKRVVENPITLKDWYVKSFLKEKHFKMNNIRTFESTYLNLRYDLVFDSSNKDLLKEMESLIYTELRKDIIEALHPDFSKVDDFRPTSIVNDRLNNGEVVTFGEWIDLFVSKIKDALSSDLMRCQKCYQVKLISKDFPELGKLIYYCFSSGSWFNEENEKIKGKSWLEQWKEDFSLVVPEVVHPEIIAEPSKPVKPASYSKPDQPDFLKNLQQERNKQRKAEKLKSDQEKLEREVLLKFPKVKLNLKNYLEVLAMQGEVNFAVEKVLFGEEKPLSGLSEKYQEAPILFGETKGKIRKAVQSKFNRGLAEDMKLINQLYAFRVAAKLRAQKIKELDDSVSSKNEVKMLEEVALIYGEILESLALKMEVDLNCGVKNLAIPSAEQILEVTGKLGQSGERLMTILQEAMNQVRAAKEVGEVVE